MWKVMIIICTLGNPCTLFVEDPMKYYQTEEECMIVADVKAMHMMNTFSQYGYYVESEAHSCRMVEDQNQA